MPPATSTRRLLLLAFAAFAITGYSAPERPLFAHDLVNADYQPDHWTMADGVLSTKGKAGIIWTRESYGDFHLSLEFRCDKSTDSGVFFRCSDVRDYVQSSLEIQITNQLNRPDRARTGALFDCAAPAAKPAIKAGVWYRLEIAAKGETVKVLLDGKPMVEANLDDWATPRKNPDGSANKFKKALKDCARSGRIGLQGTYPVAFRNLEITRL
ncbi:DUF1080 domain-containing protein [Termitidicoccus mucosus]|uniref:3-keto-alpha-glucoside-1,2-lyase/3-keto-2-hydroxy-glucal hydratase domain-containing protein n=1 Tax=Termitidicoccus mucosus TaxID=1184151 RepID=A0A178IEJ2_9BACT|nr:hypothetical protein AW736_19030 [Opitutaceae bacterium TSB47]